MFSLFPPCLAILKNAIHIWDPSETGSYSASHKERSEIHEMFQNDSVRSRFCFGYFFNLLSFSTVIKTNIWDAHVHDKTLYTLFQPLARQINYRLLIFTSASIFKVLSMLLKVGENALWVSNSLDLDKTPSCLHYGTSVSLGGLRVKLLTLVFPLIHLCDVNFPSNCFD